MTEPKIISCETEADWLHERSKIAVTASDAYTMLTKPLLHYARKKGLVDPPVQNSRMLWGKRLQGAVGRGFGEDTGRVVTPADEFTIYQHPDMPSVGCTLDFFEEDKEKGKGILETKVTDIEWGSEAPAWYQLQLQVQLSCLRFKYGTLAALHRGNNLIWMDMIPHEEVMKRFLSKAEEMAWRIATSNPPAVDSDGSEETGRALAAMFPTDSGGVVALPTEALAWTEELESFKSQKKAIEEQINLRESRLKEAIAEATYGQMVDGTRWQWKQQTRVDPPRTEARVSTFRVLRHLRGSK